MVDSDSRQHEARPYLFVALGGVIGAVSRHLVSIAMTGTFGHAELGTFVANISGAFLLGFFATVANEQIPLSLDVRRFITVGIMGSYTTFSTLSEQNWQLIENGSYFGAAINITGSLVIGLLAVIAGVALARRV